ncbi:hypothetical protein PAXRUDRAFT_781108, partial [Paxillus rubicundulus Ve08.2h10]
MKLTVWTTELPVPIQQPFLIESECHPHICIVLIAKAKLCTCLILEHPRLLCFPNNKGGNFCELSAFTMSKYVNLAFLPLIPECCLSESP